MNWKEIVKETIWGLISLAVFIPALIILYGLLATQ